MHIKRCTITLITAIIICLSATSSALTCGSQTMNCTQAVTLTDTIPTIDWNITFGQGHYNTAHQIIQAQDGGFIITGMYGSQNPLNATLVKLDSKGNLQWFQSLDLKFINYPMNTALLQTKDAGFVIVGNKYGTNALTLIKIGENGTSQWERNYSSEFLAWGMTQTSDGEYIITGVTSYVYTGTHPAAVLIKTDANGDIQWNKTYGSDKQAWFFSIVQTNDD